MYFPTFNAVCLMIFYRKVLTKAGLNRRLFDESSTTLSSDIVDCREIARNATDNIE
jgi:hypothetical protein